MPGLKFYFDKLLNFTEPCNRELLLPSLLKEFVWLQENSSCHSRHTKLYSRAYVLQIPYYILELSGNLEVMVKDLLELLENLLYGIWE